MQLASATPLWRSVLGFSSKQKKLSLRTCIVGGGGHDRRSSEMPPSWKTFDGELGSGVILSGGTGLVQLLFIWNFASRSTGDTPVAAPRRTAWASQPICEKIRLSPIGIIRSKKDDGVARR